MDLYVLSDPQHGTMHIGSVLCADLVPVLLHNGLDIQVIDVQRLADLPPWLQGTPTLYVGGSVFTGHEAFSYLQNLALSTSTTASAKTTAARGGGSPAAAGAQPAPPSSTYAPVSVTETEGGSEFGDGAFASILPPDGADDGAGEPPKLSQDEFARLNESRKNNTHPLAMSGGAPPKPFETQKD